MIAPPATPDNIRQVKNQLAEIGSAQARNARVISTFIERSVVTLLMRAASGRPSNAPTR
jgi:hypothetical protein